MNFPQYLHIYVLKIKALITLEFSFEKNYLKFDIFKEFSLNKSGPRTFVARVAQQKNLNQYYL